MSLIDEESTTSFVFEICAYIVKMDLRENLIRFSILTTWNYAQFSISFGDDEKGTMIIITVYVWPCMKLSGH